MLRYIYNIFSINPWMLLILPPILIVSGIYVAVRWWIRSKSGQGVAIKTGILISAIISTVFVLQVLYDIRTSCSSTACIGYIFLPYSTFMVCIAAYLIGWSITSIILTLYTRLKKVKEAKQKKWSPYVALCIIFLFGFWGFKATARNMLLKKARITTTNSELTKLFDRVVAKEDIELLAKLTKNPNTSEKLLEQIYSSIPSSTFQYPGSNYSSVFCELARNKKTPPDILKSLSEKRSGERIFIATNPNTPTEVLSQLAKDQDSLVRTWVCSNPNVTKESLIRLKTDPDKVVRNYAETYFQRRGFSDK